MFINILIREEKNVILDVIKIKYNQKRINNIYDIESYLIKNYNNSDNTSYCCEYEVESKKQYLYYLAKKNKKLILDTNFEELLFDDYFKITKNHTLTINAFLVGGGCGDMHSIFAIISLLLTIIDIIKKIIKIFSIFIYYFFPFYFIRRKYGYGRVFISDIIEWSDEWDYKFFSLNRMKFNSILEKSIMRKLKYHKKNKKWNKEHDPNPTKSLGKYDSF